MNLTLIIPEIFLFLWALLVLFVDLLTAQEKKYRLGPLSLVGLAITVVLVVISGQGQTFGEMFSADPYSLSFAIIFLGSAFLAISVSVDFARERIKYQGEYYALILLSTVGMMFLAASRELLSMYVSLELTTISLFVLSAYLKTELKSSEAGLKYMILGAASSAILLYGISLLYGITGTTVLRGIQAELVSSAFPGPLLVISLVFIIAGFSFKLAAVPFHMWAPDVYEGAPTPITAYLSVASKGAGLAAMVRVFFGSLLPVTSEWIPLFMALATMAMILGNIVAIRQSNIKRMLAYSSIAQVGYILVALSAASELATTSMILYLLAYMFANIGAFAVVIAFYSSSGTDDIYDYAGLSRRSPFLALSLVIFFLSLVGIPPLAGFVGKYLLFLAAIQKGYYWLVMVAVLTSVISLFYYMNVVKQMYFRKPVRNDPVKVSWSLRLALVLSLLGVIAVGVYPNPFVSLISKAASVFIY
jgi:NADH-quinone oxidoreductase subunit N